MNRKNNIIFSATAVVALGTIIFFSRAKKERKILKFQRYEVAEEGYETAFDILFPEKKKRSGRYSAR